MDIHGHDQLSGRNTFPDTEVDAVMVITHHPSQVHIEPLAGGITRGRGNMLTGSLRMIVGEEYFIKAGQGLFRRSVAWLQVGAESGFQGKERGIIFLEKGNAV